MTTNFRASVGQQNLHLRVEQQLDFCLAGSHPGRDFLSFFFFPPFLSDTLLLKCKQFLLKYFSVPSPNEPDSEMRVFLSPSALKGLIMPCSPREVWNEVKPALLRPFSGAGGTQLSTLLGEFLPQGSLSSLSLRGSVSSSSGSLLSRALLSLLSLLSVGWFLSPVALTQWCFSFSSGKQVSILFYFFYYPE